MVHADRDVFGQHNGPINLPDDEQLPLEDEKDLNQIEALLWSRWLLREIPHADLRDHGPFLAVPGQEFAPNVGLPFVGHSVVEKPTLFRPHLFIYRHGHNPGRPVDYSMRPRCSMGLTVIQNPACLAAVT